MTDFLAWLADHSSHAVFVTVLYALGLTGLVAPCAAAFGGARRWGTPAGWVGLLAGYAWGFYAIVSAMMLFTYCPPSRCSARAPLSLAETLASGVHGFLTIWAVAWPWHLIWLACGVGCLYWGLAVRRRRMTAQATTEAQKPIDAFEP